MTLQVHSEVRDVIRGSPVGDVPSTEPGGPLAMAPYCKVGIHQGVPHAQSRQGPAEMPTAGTSAGATSSVHSSPDGAHGKQCPLSWSLWHGL